MSLCNRLSLFVFLGVSLLFACNKDQDLTGRDTGGSSNNSGGNPTLTVMGYASQNGGTTGGQAGATVTASTFETLKAYLESASPMVVKVNQRIYQGAKGGSIRVNSHKTLLGEGANAFLDGIGLTLSGTANVIIRNLKFTLTSITDRSDPAVYSPTGDEGRPQILVNGGDCISLVGATQVWIDHCEFYSENPEVQTNQDLYDGLVDVKGSSAFITLSWNYFHDHHKVHLVGSSDTDNFDRRITFHHNYYKNIKQRIPLYRFGTGHFVNNYVTGLGSSGLSSRMGACLKVEQNVFENVKSPVVSDGNPVGQFHLVSNSFSGVSGIAVPSTSTCTASIPYVFVPEELANVKAKVMAGAGVGKL